MESGTESFDRICARFLRDAYLVSPERIERAEAERTDGAGESLLDHLVERGDLSTAQRRAFEVLAEAFKGASLPTDKPLEHTPAGNDEATVIDFSCRATRDFISLLGYAIPRF